MRRLVACLALVLTSTALAAPAVAGEEALTSVAVSDPKHDVEKNFTQSKKRRADLDVRRARAVLGEEDLVLSLKVADLRKRHTKDVEEDGGMHHVWAHLAVTLKFGKKREFLSYGVFGEPNVSSIPGDSAFADCFEDAESGGEFALDQYADYARDLVLFTVPTWCLPEKFDSLRVSGYTNWWNADGVMLWDHITKSRNRTKWSDTLAYS